ncbi:hypothetical protein ABOM_000668 [Aspergillus bombycis]|uniref:C2H2-type domain-containing protein n=1 Tax=Aspergillus bombycis TaxID=109264 RepID=A0A1F8AG14_9EURO|nr:hypothetical protein ABOM_000668 [Aspergillus bombycis]OGM50631.1 hypothetical protein ABOM_000668 [Aspergillus bombycis]
METTVTRDLDDKCLDSFQEKDKRAHSSMPWQAQVCTFCEKQYVHKRGLRDHLHRYTGEVRIPADGIHDVLKIERILDPDARNQCQYRCPVCSKIINLRRQFIEHVIYARHDNVSDGDSQQGTKRRRRNREWPFRFEEETVKVWQRKGTFPFLRLPFELRYMIYKFVLCFGNIKFGKYLASSFVYPDRQGFWLQHNPKNNLLTLLAVNRQVYNEARRVLYGLNSFIFQAPDTIPVFLIGIGQENAELLQSVRWMSGPQHCENQIDSIQRYLTQSEEEHIWNDEKSYLSFLAMLINKSPDYVTAYHNHRLVRLDTDCTPLRSYRVRYRMHAIFGETNGEVSKMIGTEGTISFELYKCPRRYDWNTYQYTTDSDIALRHERYDNGP